MWLSFAVTVARLEGSSAFARRVCFSSPSKPFEPKIADLSPLSRPCVVALTFRPCNRHTRRQPLVLLGVVEFCCTLTGHRGRTRLLQKGMSSSPVESPPPRSSSSAGGNPSSSAFGLGFPPPQNLMSF